MPTIGVAVPCYHGHVRILQNLLDSIEKQTRKPDMVVVSCSGVSDKDVPYRQENYSFPLKIVTTILKLSSAQNRNIAVDNLDTHIVSFIDADDQMHPQRIEILERAFQENDIVLLLHNFTKGFDNPDIIYDINNIPIHFGKLGYYYDHYLKFGGEGDVTNGHTTVLKDILNKVKFRESPHFYGKEDSVFNTDVIKLFPTKVVHCPLNLSKVVPSNTLSFVG